MWIYKTTPLLAFIAVFVFLYSASYAGYRLGRLLTSPDSKDSPYHLDVSIPSTILGLLALILGFTFSMTVSRFEHRRQLVIQEANAIGTAYLRARFFRPPYDARISKTLSEYLNMRIEFYAAHNDENRMMPLTKQQSEIENALFVTVKDAFERDRGAVESSFIYAYTSMLDIENERNFALRKTLPPMIYWSILLISAAGLLTFNFARGERGERGQWQAAILVLMISFVFHLILDLERPKSGAIQISQEAMLELRNSLDNLPK